MEPHLESSCGNRIEIIINFFWSTLCKHHVIRHRESKSSTVLQMSRRARSKTVWENIKIIPKVRLFFCSLAFQSHSRCRRNPGSSNCFSRCHKNHNSVSTGNHQWSPTRFSLFIRLSIFLGPLGFFFCLFQTNPRLLFYAGLVYFFRAEGDIDAERERGRRLSVQMEGRFLLFLSLISLPPPLPSPSRRASVSAGVDCNMTGILNAGGVINTPTHWVAFI